MLVVHVAAGLSRRSRPSSPPVAHLAAVGDAAAVAVYVVEVTVAAAQAAAAAAVARVGDRRQI